jgi:hypothetical protein
MVER